MTILGSILIYPAGGIAYIDALFLSSGGATQSGLNPYVYFHGAKMSLLTLASVNINGLNTEQQVCLSISIKLVTNIDIFTKDNTLPGTNDVQPNLY